MTKRLTTEREEAIRARDYSWRAARVATTIDAAEDRRVLLDELDAVRFEKEQSDFMVREGVAPLVNENAQLRNLLEQWAAFHRATFGLDGAYDSIMIATRAALKEEEK